MKAVVGLFMLNIRVMILKKLDDKNPPILDPTKMRLFTILDEEDLVTLATSAKIYGKHRLWEIAVRAIPIM